ncbi:MAG: sialidase family protein [Candidatus Omnitrophota bacterium]
MKRLVVVFLIWQALARLAAAAEMSWEEIGRGETGISAVLIHPQNPRVILMGGRRGVFKSEDAGKNWRNVLSIRGQDKRVNALLFGPGNPALVFAATGEGLFASRNNAVTWKRIFRGKDCFEGDSSALAVLPGEIYLGTGRGLFISRDMGRSWSKPQGRLSSSRIFSIAYSKTGKGCVYVACAAGVYKKGFDKDGWERIFTSGAPENADESEDALIEEQGDEDSQNINYISCSPYDNAVYISTPRGLYLSRDGGRAWSCLSEYGLLDKNVIFLLPHTAGGIYGVTARGVFEYRDGRWHELSFGLAADGIKYLASDNKGVLYAASERGLFRGAMLAAEAGGGYRNRPDICVSGEPEIADVQKVAIQYAEVSPEKIKLWRKQVAVKAILPKLTAGIGRDTGDLWHWESGSSTKAYDDVLIKGRDALDWDVTLSWDLSEVIWNPDQTSIDVRSKLMVQLRDDILDEVTKLYFERIRVRMELDNLQIEDKKRRFEKELRVKELTASLDALTGGYFSSQIQAKGAKT